MPEDLVKRLRMCGVNPCKEAADEIVGLRQSNLNLKGRLEICIEHVSVLRGELELKKYSLGEASDA